MTHQQELPPDGGTGRQQKPSRAGRRQPQDTDGRNAQFLLDLAAGNIGDEYRVVVKRTGWQSTKAHLRQSKRGAFQLADRVLHGTRPDLAPVCELRIEVRPVGIWVPTMRIVEAGDLTGLGQRLHRPSAGGGPS